MIKVENIRVYNLANAVYSARNPLNSWVKSDSDLEHDVLGQNDLDLAKRLIKAGPEHRKFLRQIFVSMNVTAPIYWWKEADQYKVATTTDSCSTMHKIAAKEFTRDDFSTEHLYHENLAVIDETVKALNEARLDYKKYKNKDDWWQMIQLLPSSYNQLRTWSFNYETVLSMIKQRENHKLDEWREFVEILKSLPYVEDFTEE